MSLESLQQFYERVLEDPALQERVREATDQESLVRLAVQLGQENGYDFTDEEVRQQIKEEWGQQEISYRIDDSLVLPTTY
jgi:predicted ribosomally synthesized peptide with nif11-like leader